MNRSVVLHHNTAWWSSHRATSRCTAGSARRQRSGRGGKRVAWATPIGMVMALSQLPPEQKTHGQHDRDGMAVKARPQAALILSPAQFLLDLLMELLNSMPAMGVVDQFLQRRRGRQITPIILVLLGLPTSSPLPQQPADVGLAFRRDPPGTHSYKLFAQPPLGAVPPADGALLVSGQ